MPYPNEVITGIDDYQKPVDKFKELDFFSKLKNKCPHDGEKERTKQNIKIFDIKKGDKLTRLDMETDIILIAHVFEKIIEVSTEDDGFNPIYCVSNSGYTIQCCLKYRGNNLQTLREKDMILLIENNIRAGKCSVMGDRYVNSEENEKLL